MGWLSWLTGSPRGGVDITSPAHKADPFPFYARLRAEEPVHRVTLPGGQVAWLVTRYDHVAAVLKDERFAKDKSTALTAEQAGNRQYISVGNLSENPKAFLFLMDYASRRRVKVWGTATVVEGDSELLAKLSDPTYPSRVERAIVFTVEAWDVNCPQHIHKRFSHRQVAPVIEQLRQRVRALEAELADLRRS